ncbi:uncharacterized protein LOC124144427 isoform X1 [Haliotis rufescens]|uniref:uncharacterized protein LOC124144427 isoform X1 n=2 Tax=Haliotis rufescens TaxID=6454 RepID=UPI001EB06513|nr:uncharacterized protein LOC124144427 isoform X1 [Haliotis rufescens]XP_046369771.1 uncharacterized protein LOC124144427 isoform X1 [Haliotis rufescens]XP_046369772.1 uncharacterized protein LOC124144427 isoform X1 [Haliotis rufescens]XP_046369773.1 uncharacterized protein LOC124144427 isoform X1 [Haliotis rufescens]XP_046369774.1 uncharacterized protein LOC124144427 isoform X1 [Haliotis rufescens]XP_046369775.1 uncharacterized protein LOC124144427 isoform X1 [Haliotis rufescens]XP_04636977
MVYRQCLKYLRHVKQKKHQVVRIQCNPVKRLFLWLRARSRKIFAVLCIFTLFYLHFTVLPRSMGYYNNRCYLSREEINNMKYLLTQVSAAFNRQNVTYWLDFGTLLGVWKTGEIIRYDGDIDIGRHFTGTTADAHMIQETRKLLNQFNVTIDDFQAKYKGSVADLFRWETYGNVSTKMLRKWYPFVEHFGIVERIANYLMPSEIPYDVIFPTRELTVYGEKMKIPNKPLDLLKIRYPLTWFISFPYKWKCLFASKPPS